MVTTSIDTPLHPVPHQRLPHAPRLCCYCNVHTPCRRTCTSCCWKLESASVRSSCLTWSDVGTCVVLYAYEGGACSVLRIAHPSAVLVGGKRAGLLTVPPPPPPSTDPKRSTKMCPVRSPSAHELPDCRTCHQRSTPPPPAAAGRQLAGCASPGGRSERAACQIWRQAVATASRHQFELSQACISYGNFSQSTAHPPAGPVKLI